MNGFGPRLFCFDRFDSDARESPPCDDDADASIDEALECGRDRLSSSSFSMRGRFALLPAELPIVAVDADENDVARLIDCFCCFCGGGGGAAAAATADAAAADSQSSSSSSSSSSSLCAHSAAEASRLASVATDGRFLGMMSEFISNSFCLFSVCVGSGSVGCDLFVT